MRELQVAVWGLGSHAVRNILPALQVCPGIKLYGVCSRDTEVVSRIASELACESWSETDQMLADPKVDVVYLSTPIGLHALHGRTVLMADKHLWCEKPLGENADQVTSLLGLSRERGVTLGEGFMYLYHPQFKYLRELLWSGRLGQIHSIACRFGLPPLVHPGFRIDPQLGGGAFLDVGSYPISAAASFFPDSAPDILLAEITRAPGSPVDSAGRAVLRYENDVCVALEWGINRAYRSEIDFWGNEGSVSSERVFSKPADYVPRFRFLDLHGKESSESGKADNHFVAMIKSFRSLVDDSVGAERERLLIGRRAQLADSIRQQSLA